MKSILYIGFLYLCLSVLLVSCSDSDPEPSCIQAEVIGPDCESGWYILKLENEATDRRRSYVGQLQSGYVTTDNLPVKYRKTGTKIGAEMEIIGAYGPRCVTVTVMYTAVNIKQVCESNRAATQG